MNSTSQNSSPQNVVTMKSLEGLRFVMVPTKITSETSSQTIHDHNAVYDFWVKHWEKAFGQAGAPEKGWQDHFLRQDFASGLFVGDRCVACHLYTFYDLRSHASLGGEYMHYISEIALAKMKSLNYRSVISMEYLGVDEEFRINSSGYSMTEIIGMMGLLTIEALGADGGMGMPISSNKVGKRMENVDCDILQDGIEKYGYKLRLQIMPTNPRRAHKNEEFEKFALPLWEARTDHTGLSLKPKSKIKAA